MKRFRRNQSDGEFSGDSFLDIVANLVGILVILITVIGVQAKHAYVDSETDSIDSASAVAMLPELPNVEEAASSVRQLKANIQEQELETKRIEMEMNARMYERDQLLLKVRLAEQQLTEQKETLDERQQRQFDTEQELAQLQQELTQTLQQQQGLSAEENKRPIKLDHLPTPMAKTVFGQEEHFRLLNGRLRYVPLRRMVQMLKEEAPHQVWKLKNANEITETLGPVEGFNLRYTLHRRKVAVPTSQGSPVIRQIVELKKFTVVPATENPGATIDEAIQPGSDLMERLAGWDREETILTVWTYPESFDEFRRLKNDLFQVGFLTAARPLPAGHPITGSPNGSRSAAQ